MSTETGRPASQVRCAPLVPVALALAMGIIADRYAEPWGTAAWAGIAAVLGWASFAVGGCGPMRQGLLLLALGAVGGSWHHWNWSDIRPDDLAWAANEAGRPGWIGGVIADVPSVRPGSGAGEEELTRAVLHVLALNDGRGWRPASGRAQLWILGRRDDLAAGEIVEAAGRLATLAAPLNPGEFDPRQFWRAEGIRVRLTADPKNVQRLATASGWSARTWIGGLRGWSHRRLVERLDPKVAPLAAALLLGRREAVDPEVNDAFGRTGTTHLLAISGLHLQVLAAVFWLIFRLLGLGRRGAFAAVAGATVAYALLVGLMPSVVRSVAMTVTACLAGILDREHRPCNVFALAAIVTLALNPAHLFDVGCQLSFLAIGAIAWGVAPALRLSEAGLRRLSGRGLESPLDALERRLEPSWKAMLRRMAGSLGEGVVVSVVVWLAALPLVALRFHIVSPIGVLLNVPLIPLTSLALLAAGLTLGLSAIAPVLGMPTAWACSVLLAWTERIVRWGAGRSWGHTFVAGPGWGWVVAFYVLLAAATAAGIGRWPLRRWGWTALCAWLVLGLAGGSRPPGVTEAEVLAVGHGLAVVVRTEDGHTLLYDCGRMRDPSVGRRIIAPALWARGVRRLDGVILSHADADHYNGLTELLDRFPIRAVAVPPGFDAPANPGAVALLKRVRDRGIPVRTMVQGEHWQTSATRFEIWHPPRVMAPQTSDNARSLVLDVESGGRHLVLTGDLEDPGLSVIRARPSPRPDVILAPHHGGRTSNTEAFYAWARPKSVVVSQKAPPAGRRDPLAGLAANGVPVLRTWQRGAVRLRWGTGGIEARGFVDSPN